MISSGGAITNTPAFRAGLTSDQGNIANNTLTVIQINSKDFDTGVCYNNTGSTVTLNGISTPAYSFAPNIAGKYFFNVKQDVQMMPTGTIIKFLF